MDTTSIEWAAIHSAAPPAGSRAMRVLMLGLFFLSGLVALIYQTAWQRLLGALVGSDSVGTTMIVSAFLLGLGIGSRVGGSWSDRLSSRSALRVFAFSEMSVGVFACFTRTVFHDLLLRDDALVGAAWHGWVLVVVALLVPTVLMGMSLPLLSRVVVDALEEAPARIGWLYGLNTLGAAAGAVLAGWVLVGTVGLAMTVYVGAAINFLIGGSAWIASARCSAVRPARPRTSRPAAGRAGGGGWPAMVFASGFLIISLEIVWFRVIGTLMRSDAYTFSMILGVFLVGDALGIIAGSGVARRLSQPRLAFQFLHGIVGLCAVGALATVFAIDRYTAVTFFEVDSAYVTGRGPLISLLLVFPAAFLLGASFPIAQRAIQDDAALVGQRVGMVQLSNILGNTAGASITGLVLLHWLGTAPTIRLIGAGCLAFCAMPFIRGVHRRHAGVLCLALASLVTIFPTNAGFWTALHSTKTGDTAIAFEDRTGLAVLRQSGEGINATDTLFVVGDPISHVPFGATHVVLGALGALVHPNPKDVLIIGQGTGGTPMAAGANPNARSIHVVEIVAPVLDVMREAARRSGSDSLHALIRDYDQDPRVTRTAADARHRLLSDRRRYDLIEADAIFPTTSLAGQLYSTDFFRLVRQRLTPGGLFVQWVPTPRTLAGVLAVFPYVVLLNDTVAIASEAPVDLSQERLQAAVAGPIGDRLSQMGYSRRLTTAWLFPRAVQRWTPDDARTDQDVNTDIFPKDEYYRNTRKIDFGAR